MRCYLMKGGHIAAVKELSPDLFDEEAIEQCRFAFKNSPIQIDDFEVWQRHRKVYQHSLDQDLLAFSLKHAVWP